MFKLWIEKPNNFCIIISTSHFFLNIFRLKFRFIWNPIIPYKKNTFILEIGKHKVIR
jgi:hypothetical protein